MENSSNITTSSFWANLFKSPTTQNDLETMLCSLPPFNQLKKKNTKELMKIIHTRVYSPNEYIFMEGDPGIGMYIVEEGEVVILKDLGNGIEEEFARFSKGDFFGELSTLFEDVRSASAKAVTDTKLAVMFRPDLDDFIDKYPKEGIKILRGFTHIVITRLRKMNEDYVALKLKILKQNKELQNVENQ